MGSIWMWFLPIIPLKNDLNGYIYDINEDKFERLKNEKQRKRQQFKLSLGKDKSSMMKF
jgi:hypothetical protein